MLTTSRDNLEFPLDPISSNKLDICLLYAAAHNGVIGRNNSIPWTCPEDLTHFKKLTSDPLSAVAMGYKTWESLPIGKTSGEKLAGRSKIVFTTKVGLPRFKNTIFLNQANDFGLENALRGTDIKTVYIIGGANIIYQFMYHADRAIVTRIYENVTLENNDVTVKWTELERIFQKTYHTERLSDKATVQHYVRADKVSGVDQASGRLMW